MPPLTEDPCNDTGNPGLRSSGLPGEYGTSMRPKMSFTTSQPKPPCAKCRKKREQRGMKYIQPEVPASYKPESTYKKPSYALESGTIYRLSYPGVDGDMMKDCKPTPNQLRDNIRPSTQPFSQDTTFRLSFTGVPGERAVSYKPLYRTMMGGGPMQSVTTHRHDYSPKIAEKPILFKTQSNIHLSTAKMENGTTMSLSYQPVEAEKVESYKPREGYRKSDYKFEQDTINRLSYQPWDPMPKEELPWKKKESYKQPNYAMENHTIYRASYLPAGNYEKPIPYKPFSCIGPVSSDKPLESATIYRESYQDTGPVAPPEPIVKRENIFLSSQPMSQDTTARLSYTGVGGERAIPYKPLLRSMMGAGPMASMTTQRHDFTAKPFVPTENFKPRPTLLSSDYKMEDTTTFRASYLPNDTMPKTESYKPVSVYRKNNYPLESDTINRLSYQPWTPTPKEEYPWMKRPRYEQPKWVMDNTSIYRGSFMPPGSYIPDASAGYGGGDEECDCQVGQTATDDL